MHSTYMPCTHKQGERTKTRVGKNYFINNKYKVHTSTHTITKKYTKLQMSTYNMYVTTKNYTAEIKTKKGVTKTKVTLNIFLQAHIFNYRAQDKDVYFTKVDPSCQPGIC